jgi:hypothetical protein
LTYSFIRIRLRSSCLLVFLFVLSACGTIALPVTPVDVPESAPLPAFLYHVYPAPGQTDRIKERLCAHLNEAELWEPGDEGNMLGRIGSSFQFQLDDVVVPRGDADFWGSGPIYFVEEEGQRGNYAALSVICNEINLLPGLHEAHVEITSSSGILYSYNWYFRADQVVPNPDVLNIRLASLWIAELVEADAQGE